MREVDLRQELLDKLLTELALHERIGRDHADKACAQAPDLAIPA